MSGTPAIGSIRLGLRPRARPRRVARGVSMRFSWHPTQLTLSPGCTVMKLCIRFTDRSF